MSKKIPYSNFKHGQRCTCEIDGEKMTDTSIAIRENGTVGISYGGGYLRILLKKDEDYKEGRSGITNLTLLPRTIEDVEEGDEIVSKDVGERKVLGRCGQIVFLGRLLSNDAYEDTYSIHDLKFRGYTIKQDTPPEEEVKTATETVMQEQFRKDAEKAEQNRKDMVEAAQFIIDLHEEAWGHCKITGIPMQHINTFAKFLSINTPLDQLRIKE